MCGVYHGCAVIRGPQKNGRHHVIGSPSRPRAPKISRMTSLAAHAPFIGCTCAVHGAIILTLLLLEKSYSVAVFERSLRVHHSKHVMFYAEYSYHRFTKKEGRRPNPNDSRSVALSVGPAVVNDSRSFQPPPPYPRTL